MSSMSQPQQEPKKRKLTKGYTPTREETIEYEKATGMKKKFPDHTLCSKCPVMVKNGEDDGSAVDDDDYVPLCCYCYRDAHELIVVEDDSD